MASSLIEKTSLFRSFVVGNKSSSALTLQRTDVMEKEMCLKFLVHLYKFSQRTLAKTHIDAVDITYINNEVENFHRKIDHKIASLYDKSNALAVVENITQETVADKAMNISLFLLKSKFKVLKLFFGAKDDAHQKRFEKVSEFNEKIKKVLAVLEYA